MSKKFRTKNAKYKSAVCGVVAVLASFAMFAGACANTTTSEEEESGTTTRVDEQVLKNGNFEFFEDNDGNYLYGIPDNWSSATGSNATASDSQSGVLNTTAANWNRLTDTALPQTLWNNAALDTDDEDYVNYNGDPTDLPFRDPAAAILENEDDDEDDETDDYYIAEGAEYIANPYTHSYRWVTEDGKDVLYDADGNEVTYYLNEDDGEYYTSADFSEDSRIESNVLMIHNYVDDDKQGTQTYYSSSTTLTLEANTAAKLSVWVKTSDLFFGGNNDTRTEVIDQRGAYIELAQTVGGNTIDAFRIENINTAVLNPYDEETGEWQNGNNGWVQYTLYVSACDYAQTTITLTLGLGEASNYTLEGYAFFDDITYEKYLNVGDMIDANAQTEEDFQNLVDTTTCTLLSEPEEKIFRVDKEVFNETITVPHYSANYNYYIDLAISAQLGEEGRTSVALGTDNLTAGLTKDADGYVSSKDNGETKLVGNVTPADNGTTYKPVDLNLNVKDDIIANLTVTTADSWSSAIGGNYQSEIDEALKTAVSLPGVTDDSASTLLILSARGAAYEAVIRDNAFTINNDGYKIVSFWVKTSELDGKATVTVSARQVGDEDNAGSFSVDSTTVDTVTINDTEDVYNGWVQCYALVSCNLEDTEDSDSTQQFELVVNYGATTIKGTTAADYYGGWAAVTNISVLDVNDEKAFGYADSDTRAASLSITEDTSSDSFFDDAFGNGNEIETQITRPSSYNGVNGGSAHVSGQPVDTSVNPDLHKQNSNPYAGLVNKDYREAYAETYAQLLTDLNASPMAALFGSDAKWNEVFGTATQPLLIVNAARTLAGESAIYNYGYYGSDSTASADSYTAVSVKVKVSEGAVATVYLVDPETKQPLSYSTPEYTFWYDNDGNVLKGEPAKDASRDEQRENIAYTLESNGLYSDGEGNYYANLFNYKREYYDERADYYTADGTKVTFDFLDPDTVYYADAQASHYAPHYLVTSDGTRVYKYIENTGFLYNAEYYYMVEGQPDENTVVKMFDTTLAVPRYTAEQSNPYSFTIDAIANPDLADKWITVNFFIHTGSESKSYRLELWSGTRDGMTYDGVEEGSYVLFDYSTVTVDSTSYANLVSYYTGRIIDAYKEALRKANADIVFDSNEESVAYYEKLAKENNVTVDLYSYEAQYYTYTLYDSATYVPFNKDTAEEGESGYNYAYSDYSEDIAVLRINDIFRSDSTVNGTPMLNMFIDYSLTDKSISMTTTSDVTEDEEDTTTTPTDATNVWLLASSIVMVIAILVAIIVLLLRDLRKKFKRRPKVSKNTYNYKKNKRYVRTYVKEHGEAPATETPADNLSTTTENQAEATPEAPAQTEDVQPSEVTEEQSENQPEESEKPDGENS